MLVTDKDPHRDTTELLVELKYPAGWQDILHGSDASAVEYQLWLNQLVTLTRDACAVLDESPLWVSNEDAILNRWQRAIELVAEVAILPESYLDDSQRVETALLTVHANIESIQWELEGIRFVVPNMRTGGAETIDLLNLQSFAGGQSI